MGKRSNKNTNTRKRLDPTIVVAIIGLVGTLAAALLAIPLLERWFASQPSQAATAV